METKTAQRAGRTAPPPAAADPAGLTIPGVVPYHPGSSAASSVVGATTEVRFPDRDQSHVDTLRPAVVPGNAT